MKRFAILFLSVSASFAILYGLSTTPSATISIPAQSTAVEVSFELSPTDGWACGCE